MQIVFPLSILVGIALRIFVSVINRGYYFPDEYFHYVETPYQWLFPEHLYHLDPSEDLPYRSSFILLIHYALLWGLKTFGTYTPHGAEITLKTWMSLSSLLYIFFCVKICRKQTTPQTARWLAMLLMLWYYLISFSPHFLSENYSVIFTTIGFYELSKSNKQSDLWFGFWIAIATQFRLQSALFVLGPVLYFLFKRETRRLVFLCMGFWGCILLFGLAETGYKGAPFTTLISYYKVNISERKLLFEFADPWYTYWSQLNAQFGEWFFPVFLFYAFYGLFKKSPLLGLSILCFVLFHQLLPQKMIRFLFPITPILFTYFVIGMTLLKNKALRIYTLAALTFTQIHHSYSKDFTGGATGEACFLLTDFGKDPDLQHVNLFEDGLFCGYFSLHRDIAMNLHGLKPWKDFLESTPQTHAKGMYIISNDKKEALRAWLSKHNIFVEQEETRRKVSMLITQHE